VPKVLVIEDNPEHREIYSSLLYYNGFDVDHARTAEEGFRIARARKPDVILVDIMLPGIDGLRATTYFKTDPLTADVPVICISAHPVPPSKVQQAGADDYLRKPLTGDVMVRSIRNLIGWDDAHLHGSSGRALLIAARDSRVAAALAASLRKLGFGISRCSDGATGLGTASAIRPQLIAIDLNAPVIDGWKLMIRLKASPGIAQIPVLAFSDSPTDAEKQAVAAAGFAAYIMNPDDADALRAEIVKHTRLLQN
jgi:CheY-like chemotaxis protein